MVVWVVVNVCVCNEIVVFIFCYCIVWFDGVFFGYCWGIVCKSVLLVCEVEGREDVVSLKD